MTFEDTLSRSLHDHLDPVDSPGVDLDAVRRRGERRRAATTAAGMLAALALVTGGTALATLPGQGDRAVRPAQLPAMDFGDGIRAFYDDGRGELHIGDRTVPVDWTGELDLTASATPWGVVYFTPWQEARLVTEDGTDRRLAAPPEEPARFHPRVEYDASAPLVAWLTRDAGDVVLTVHRMGEDEGVVGTTRVPCRGENCEWQAVAGIDHGKVFVRGPRRGTLVFDVADLQAPPVRLGTFTVADVRNRVLLGLGVCCGEQDLGPGWRTARAEGVESLLTRDGRYELYWSSTLGSTDGSAPLRLEVPEHEGVEFLALDSDGSVMVAVMVPNEGSTYYDCEVPTGDCEVIGELGRRSGDPVFLGTDM